MSKMPNTQDPISKEVLHEYLTYVLTGQIKDNKHAKRLRRHARRVPTLSDLVVVFNLLHKRHETAITQLIDTVQIQDKVLKKLGATDEMFEEAKEEHKKELEEIEKQLKEVAEEKKKQLKAEKENENNKEGKEKQEEKEEKSEDDKDMKEDE